MGLRAYRSLSFFMTNMVTIQRLHFTLSRKAAKTLFIRHLHHILQTFIDVWTLICYSQILIDGK